MLSYVRRSTPGADKFLIINFQLYRCVKQYFTTLRYFCTTLRGTNTRKSGYLFPQKIKQIKSFISSRDIKVSIGDALTAFFSCLDQLYITISFQTVRSIIYLISSPQGETRTLFLLLSPAIILGCYNFLCTFKCIYNGFNFDSLCIFFFIVKFIFV